MGATQTHDAVGGALERAVPQACSCRRDACSSLVLNTRLRPISCAILDGGACASPLIESVAEAMFSFALAPAWECATAFSRPVPVHAPVKLTYYAKA